MVFAAVGVIIGEIGAGLLMPPLSSQLFGVSPRDPLTFAAVPSLFLVFAWLASYVSARRATSVDLPWCTTPLRAESLP